MVAGWEIVFVSTFGVVFITTLLVLAVLFPHPTAFQLLVFRTTLALSAAGIAAAIPGFLNISMDLTGLALRAGGALAVFVLVYRLNPARTIVHPGSEDEGSEEAARPARSIPTARRSPPEIETLEHLNTVVSGLSANQKRLLARISRSADGVHVGDLVMELQLSRSDLVYRARDLQRDGLIEIQNLTDQYFVLSKSVKKLIGLHQKIVPNLLQQGN